MDPDANSSTVTLGRLAGFGGAPNMGHDPKGRRHGSPPWLSLISAEAERSPEIGRTFYDAGPRRGVERVAELLTVMAVDGHLDLDDPMDAAHQFLGLAQSRYFKARLCNAIPELTERQIADEAALAARTFMRAFGRR